jgi:N6-L-threonylcarbamoyladenine synthase
MIVLGIETSCDETSAAVIRDGKLLSNVTTVQLIHAQYGGVVPELASRAHQKLIVPSVEEALARAEVTNDDLDAIAAVYGPGLIGSILVGLSFGKAMAWGLGIPFIGVNHMEGHIFSNLIDDAAGEAFDKVAKMLNIGYPGGPLIDSYAARGNPAAVDFPRSYLGGDSFDFSFSGVKTSVLYYLKRMGFEKRSAGKDEKFLADVCASFQASVVDVLVRKLVVAATRYGVGNIAIAGGVSANSELRRRSAEVAREHGLNLFIPKFEYCTDNGAMIAMVGYYRMLQGNHSNLELTAEPGLSLARQDFA